MDLKLEVLFVPVSDVDRAKAFYESLGFRLDLDYIASDEYRVAHLTPPGSEASIIIGKSTTAAAPGSLQNQIFAVKDILATRADLADKGVDVSEVFHYADGFIFHIDNQHRVAGPHPRTRRLQVLCNLQRPGRQHLAPSGNQHPGTRTMNDPQRFSRI